MSLVENLERLFATVEDVPPSIKILKINEELGEVVEAFIGVGGWNPRKGLYSTTDEIALELADVALSALVALREFAPNAVELFEARLAAVAERAEAVA